MKKARPTQNNVRMKFVSAPTTFSLVSVLIHQISFLTRTCLPLQQVLKNTTITRSTLLKAVTTSALNYLTLRFLVVSVTYPSLFVVTNQYVKPFTLCSFITPSKKG